MDELALMASRRASDIFSDRTISDPTLRSLVCQPSVQTLFSGAKAGEFLLRHATIVVLGLKRQGG